jgi:hypothetical protein
LEGKEDGGEEDGEGEEGSGGDLGEGRSSGIENGMEDVVREKKEEKEPRFPTCESFLLDVDGKERLNGGKTILDAEGGVFGEDEEEKKIQRKKQRDDGE